MWLKAAARTSSCHGWRWPGATASSSRVWTALAGHWLPACRARGGGHACAFDDKGFTQRRFTRRSNHDTNHLPSARAGVAVGHSSPLSAMAVLLTADVLSPSVAPWALLACCCMWRCAATTLAASFANRAAPSDGSTACSTEAGTRMNSVRCSATALCCAVAAGLQQGHEVAAPHHTVSRNRDGCLEPSARVKKLLKALPRPTGFHSRSAVQLAGQGRRPCRPPGTGRKICRQQAATP